MNAGKTRLILSSVLLLIGTLLYMIACILAIHWLMVLGIGLVLYGGLRSKALSTARGDAPANAEDEIHPVHTGSKTS